jgi:transposase-like protein
MSILVLKLPDVKRKREERPRGCPYCKGETFQRWGQVKKPVKDTRCRNVRVYRYRCCRCKRTFRHYPGGTSRADQTKRLQLFAVICWQLGLSHRGVSKILSGLGIQLSAMTVWRDAQDQERELRRQNANKGVRVLGLDGAYVLGWGEKRPVLVAVDLGEGQPVAVGYVDEHDPQAVRRWLEPLVQQMGVSVIVTDDLTPLPHDCQAIEPGASSLPVPCPPLGWEDPERAGAHTPPRMAVGGRRSQRIDRRTPTGRQDRPHAGRYPIGVITSSATGRSPS